MSLVQTFKRQFPGVVFSSKSLACFAISMALTGCGETSPDLGQLDLAGVGRDIAERNCARCHSIERSGVSPNASAPPLRLVLQDFDIEALATDFREHIQVGTDEMPNFDFSPKDTDALMAYLLTIEVIEKE